MKILWKWGCLGGLSVGVAVLLLLGFHCSGDWELTDDAQPARVLDVSAHVDLLSPRRTLWLPNPPRVLSVYSPIFQSASTSEEFRGDPAEYRMVILSLEDGRVRSPASDLRLIQRARPVLGDFKLADSESTEKRYTDEQGGSYAIVRFSGFHFRYPWYDAGGFWAGTPGWEWVDSFTGSFEISFLLDDGAPPTPALRRRVINTSSFSAGARDFAWIDGGRYLVFDDWKDHRIFVFGPFQEAHLQQKTREIEP